MQVNSRNGLHKFHVEPGVVRRDTEAKRQQAMLKPQRTQVQHPSRHTATQCGY